MLKFMFLNFFSLITYYIKSICIHCIQLYTLLTYFIMNRIKLYLVLIYNLLTMIIAYIYVQYTYNIDLRANTNN